MTAADAIEDLGKLAGELSFQSANPYNNSRKERHVRVLLAEYSQRVEEAMAALTKKKASKRGK